MYASALVALVLVCIASETAAQYQQVLLSEVQALTFFRHRDTAARRTSPIPQLKCIGDHQLCQAKYLPSAVQCINVGLDGIDVQWQCKAELDADVVFEAFHVSCEGFQGPDDPFVLEGSCGLEYKLKFTNAYIEKKRAQDELIAERRKAANMQNQGGSYTSKEEDSGWGFQWFIIACAVIFGIVWCTKKSNRKLTSTNSTPTPTNSSHYAADPSPAYGNAPSGPDSTRDFQTHTYPSSEPIHIINEQHVTSHTFVSSTPPGLRTTTGYMPPSNPQPQHSPSDKSVHTSTGFGTTSRR